MQNQKYLDDTDSCLIRVAEFDKVCWFCWVLWVLWTKLVKYENYGVHKIISPEKSTEETLGFGNRRLKNPKRGWKLRNFKVVVNVASIGAEKWKFGKVPTWRHWSGEEYFGEIMDDVSEAWVDLICCGTLTLGLWDPLRVVVWESLRF